MFVTATNQEVFIYMPAAWKLYFYLHFSNVLYSGIIINSKSQVLAVLNQSSWVYNIRLISKEVLLWCPGERKYFC